MEGCAVDAFTTQPSTPSSREPPPCPQVHHGDGPSPTPWLHTVTLTWTRGTPVLTREEGQNRHSLSVSGYKQTKKEKGGLAGMAQGLSIDL